MGYLVVEVVKAENLDAKDRGGSSDPYCIVELGKKKFETEKIDSTLFPVWEKHFVFNDIASPAGTLRFTVNDHNKILKNELIGDCDFQLSLLNEDNLFFVEEKNMLLRGTNKDGRPSEGTIHFRVAFYDHADLPSFHRTIFSMEFLELNHLPTVTARGKFKMQAITSDVTIDVQSFLTQGDFKTQIHKIAGTSSWSVIRIQLTFIDDENATIYDAEVDVDTTKLKDTTPLVNELEFKVNSSSQFGLYAPRLKLNLSKKSIARELVDGLVSIRLRAAKKVTTSLSSKSDKKIFCIYRVGNIVAKAPPRPFNEGSWDHTFDCYVTIPPSDVKLEVWEISADGTANCFANGSIPWHQIRAFGPAFKTHAVELNEVSGNTKKLATVTSSIAWIPSSISVYQGYPKVLENPLQCNLRFIALKDHGPTSSSIGISVSCDGNADQFSLIKQVAGSIQWEPEVLQCVVYNHNSVILLTLKDTDQQMANNPLGLCMIHAKDFKLGDKKTITLPLMKTSRGAKAIRSSLELQYEVVKRQSQASSLSVQKQQAADKSPEVFTLVTHFKEYKDLNVMAGSKPSISILKGQSLLGRTKVLAKSFRIDESIVAEPLASTDTLHFRLLDAVPSSGEATLGSYELAVDTLILKEKKGVWINFEKQRRKVVSVYVMFELEEYNGQKPKPAGVNFMSVNAVEVVGIAAGPTVSSKPIRLSVSCGNWESKTPLYPFLERIRLEWPVFFEAKGTPNKAWVSIEDEAGTTMLTGSFAFPTKPAEAPVENWLTLAPPKFDSKQPSAKILLESMPLSSSQVKEIYLSFSNFEILTTKGASYFATVTIGDAEFHFDLFYDVPDKDWCFGVYLLLLPPMPDVVHVKVIDSTVLQRITILGEAYVSLSNLLSSQQGSFEESLSLMETTPPSQPAARVLLKASVNSLQSFFKPVSVDRHFVAPRMILEPKFDDPQGTRFIIFNLHCAFSVFSDNLVTRQLGCVILIGSLAYKTKIVESKGTFVWADTIHSYSQNASEMIIQIIDNGREKTSLVGEARLVFEEYDGNIQIPIHVPIKYVKDISGSRYGSIIGVIKLCGDFPEKGVKPIAEEVAKEDSGKPESLGSLSVEIVDVERVGKWHLDAKKSNALDINAFDYEGRVAWQSAKCEGSMISGDGKGRPSFTFSVFSQHDDLCIRLLNPRSSGKSYYESIITYNQYVEKPHHIWDLKFVDPLHPEVTRVEARVLVLFKKGSLPLPVLKIPLPTQTQNRTVVKDGRPAVEMKLLGCRHVNIAKIFRSEKTCLYLRVNVEKNTIITAQTAKCVNPDWNERHKIPLQSLRAHMNLQLVAEDPSQRHPLSVVGEATIDLALVPEGVWLNKCYMLKNQGREMAKLLMKLRLNAHQEDLIVTPSDSARTDDFVLEDSAAVISHTENKPSSELLQLLQDIRVEREQNAMLKTVSSEDILLAI
eukprot:TRINITY_DN5422_c0_g1_i3.p1 TRINITY_DN5422_c0_g1~~TRINITY_DN5422_c0_g1_i3.p1  ORF type:complete len:1438 (+),score=268.59 TRINITY_DN5422_c0_g1_i3:84-4397(+)